jgi:hypothetical protein
VSEKRTTSPWVWVAVGCGVVVVLLVLGVATVGFLGYRWARNVERTMEDPAARTDKAKSILGAEELPPGYYGVAGISVPFLFDMAMLSDREPPPGPKAHPQLGERGFVYIKMIVFGSQSDELRDFFEGRTDDADILRRNHIRIRAEEILHRGAIDLDSGSSLMYLVQRGKLGLLQGEREGLSTLMLVACPDDRRSRLGIWFGPEGEGISGSPEDEAAIRAFIAPFHFCRG